MEQTQTIQETTTTTTKEKKKLTDKQIFWIKFAVWTLFSCILPVAFIGWRFKLFSKISSVSLSGWGLLAIIIICVFILTIIKYVKKGLPYSFFTQCVNGFCKIILPLAATYFVLYVMQQNLEIFLQALGCTILCEMCAIPVNPFPKWLNDNKIKESENAMDTFLTKFFDKKKESEK